MAGHEETNTTWSLAARQCVPVSWSATIGTGIQCQPKCRTEAFRYKQCRYLPPVTRALDLTCVACACSKDKPEDLGFPAVEAITAAKPNAPKPNLMKQLVNTVLKNPFIWGMALTYFFIYVVRQVSRLALRASQELVTRKNSDVNLQVVLPVAIYQLPWKHLAA